MTSTDELASFARDVSYETIAEEARDELKKRLLDSIGIGINAIGEEPVMTCFETVDATAADGAARLWGSEQHVAPSGAAFYNTALIRYLDYMDSFLAPSETPHPSDNIGSIIAIAQDEGLSGKELLAAIGVAYEVQAELAWNAPVRDKGWDHVTHTVISQAVSAGHAANLSHEELRRAIGIAGTGHNALRVTRTGGINEWKGIASANAARNAVYAVELARHGMDGPTNLFEGHKGWEHIVSGEFDVDLSTGCERVFDTMTKRYVAETYAQSAVEGIIELAEEQNIDGDNVDRIHLDTFHGAKLIIGGGEGSRYEVESKAQADHSLPYMLAAALLDREMTNAQYDLDRIERDDVQSLLRTVDVTENDTLTERFENGEMPAHLTITMDDGTTHRVEKDAFSGHPTNPMSWEQVTAKFRQTTDGRYDEARQDEIIERVKNIEDYTADELVALLD